MLEVSRCRRGIRPITVTASVDGLWARLGTVEIGPEGPEFVALDPIAPLHDPGTQAPFDNVDFVFNPNLNATAPHSVPEYATAEVADLDSAIDSAGWIWYYGVSANLVKADQL